MVMKIDTDLLERVVFAYPDNGTRWDQDDAKSYLEVGKEYTLIHKDIGQSRTDIRLAEFCGGDHPIEFNSVMFDNVKETRKSDRIEQIRHEMDETMQSMGPAYINDSVAFNVLKKRYGELAGELVIEQIAEIYESHSEGEVLK